MDSSNQVTKGAAKPNGGDLVSKYALIDDTIDQSEQLTTADVKKRLRHLGLTLKAKVQEFTMEYAESEISINTIDSTSKKINECEAKNGQYLSLVRRNEALYQRYIEIHFIKETKQGRLDKALSAVLRKSNPHIAELTSFGRASRITESLLRLYENERAALYEATMLKQLHRITERDVLESVRDILRFCYTRCKDLATKQSNEILRHMTLAVKYSITNCPETVRLRIKKLMKLGTPYTLPFIQNTIRREVVREPNLRLLIKMHSIQRPPLRVYVDLGSEITWLMQCQDPPMVLDFTKDGEHLNFRPYKTDGTEIDFVIWPTLLLHKNGKVLSNGVAEFIRLTPPGSPLPQSSE